MLTALQGMTAACLIPAFKTNPYPERAVMMGITFGNRTDIYNPWSIINYLDTKKMQCYWAKAIEICLVKKGGIVPQSTSSAFVKQ